MRMQGNRMPGQNARTDDAYLLVLKHDCMIVPRQPARPAIRATASSAQNWLKISEPVIDSPATYSNAGIELFLATERRSKNLGAMSWSMPGCTERDAA
jgi:hypothetical protein